MQPEVINPETTPPSPVTTPPQAPISPQPSLAPSQSSATKKGHLNSITKLILFIVILALCSGGAYYWQHKKVNDSNAKVASLQTQLSSLQSQVNKLSKQK